MRRLFANTVIYGLGSVANQALSLILLPLYTRYLAPAEYGVLAVLAATGAVLMLLGALGIHSGLTRIYFLHESEADRSAVAFSALVFGAATALAFWTLCAALAPMIAEQLLDDAAAAPLWRIASATYSIAAVSAIATGTLQVQDRARAYVTCNLLGLVVSLGLSVTLVAFAGRGVRGALEGQLVGLSVELGLALAFALRRLSPRFSRTALRDMLAFSLPLVPTNLTSLGIGLADRYFLKHYSGLAEVGLYSLGYRLGSILEVLVVRPFSTAWYPYLFSILGQPDHREVVARVLEYFAMAGAAVLLAVSLFAGDVVRVMAEPAFWPAERVVFWILLGLLLRGTTTVTVAGIHVARKTHWVGLIFALALGIDVLLLWLLVPGHGMMGAAWAVVGTFAFVTVAFAGVAHRLYPLPFRPAKVLMILGAAAALVAAARFLTDDVTDLRNVAVRALCLLAFPPALYALRCIDAGDLRRLRDEAVRLRARLAGADAQAGSTKT